MFDKIHDLIRKNDVTAYDAYRSTLSKDANLNKEYQDYMQMLVDNREKYNVPLVSDDYLANHIEASFRYCSRNNSGSKIEKCISEEK